jgi:hypothetical protein
MQRVGREPSLTRRRFVQALSVSGAALLLQACQRLTTPAPDPSMAGSDLGPGLTSTDLASATDMAGATDMADGTNQAPPDLALAPWAVLPAPTFVKGTSEKYDLTATLPPGAPTGGTFAVDPSGAALPAGMSLSAAGVLSVGGAAVGSTKGVVFSYTAP